MTRKKRTYLDWAAAAPVLPQAARAFNRALRTYGNPSAAHAEGRAARGLLEEARRTIAQLVEAKADDVIFTSGATEANALAIQGHVRALIQSGRAAKDIHILYSPTAHASLVKNIEALARGGVQVEKMAIHPSGKIDTDALAERVTENTALVSMDAVCGETGTIWNTREVRHVLETRGAPHDRPLLHIDASQAPLTERVTRSHWGADMLVLDAQKVGGVRGTGVLVAHRTIPIEPRSAGGGQERGVRPGTESVAGAVSCAAALTATATRRAAFRARAVRQRQLLEELLEKIPDTRITHGAHVAPHIVNVSFVGRDTDYLVALLDEAGYAVTTKSACETDAAGSHVVLALTGNESLAASTVRISWGPGTSSASLRQCGNTCRRAVQFLDEKHS